MEKEERLTKQIKTVYTEIAKRLVDPSFSFPEGGQAKRQLSKFIVNFTQICGGEFNTSRLVDANWQKNASTSKSFRAK